MSSVIDFGQGDPTYREALGSTDPVCETCGAPVNWSGRGRKPKYCDEHKTTSSRKGSTASGRVSEKELNAACESLMAVYDALLIPLMLASPNAAQTWKEQIEPLDARNRLFLANNRDLVRKINSNAERGGTIAFALSHLMAVAPVTFVLYRDFMMGKRSASPSPEPFSPPFNWSVDLDGTTTPHESTIPFAVDVDPDIDPDAAFRK